MKTDKIEFVYQVEGAPKVTLTLSAESTLGQVLEAFEMFLLASGYSFKGQVDIVDFTNDELYDPKAEEN